MNLAKTIGKYMWIYKLSKKQFLLYAQQNARLNTAYWLAMLIRHKSDVPIGPVARAEIESFERQIKLLLKHVRKDIRKQKGLSLDTTRPALKFTASMCRQSIRVSKRSFIAKLIGIADIGDGKALKEEIAYLDFRHEQFITENLFEGDLLGQWDRAVRLVYQVLDIKAQSRALIFSRRAIQARLNTARQLLTPTALKIRQFTSVYIAYLDLGADQATTLEAQLTEDIKQQFAAGISLLDYVTNYALSQFGFFARILDKKGVEGKEKWIEENGRPALERLILSTIAPSDTLRRAIDTHVLE